VKIIIGTKEMSRAYFRAHIPGPGLPERFPALLVLDAPGDEMTSQIDGVNRPLVEIEVRDIVPGEIMILGPDAAIQHIALAMTWGV